MCDLCAVLYFATSNCLDVCVYRHCCGRDIEFDNTSVCVPTRMTMFMTDVIFIELVLEHDLTSGIFR